MSELTGRRILVTGGSRGIGLEVSRVLAERGAAVIVAARDAAVVEAAVAELSGSGHVGVAFDVADDAAWSGAMARLDGGGPLHGPRFDGGGPLHGFVAAAGVLGPIGGIDEVEPAALIEAIQINLIGTLLGLHYVVPRLAAVGGRAVTFSGGGGTSPLPRYDAYAASKAGVVRATENVAASGVVEINAVAPGFVATRMHEGTLSAGPDAAGGDYYERTQRQLAEGGFPARAAAELVAFLLSDAARGITGRLISAQWDPWQDPGFQARLRDERDFATLRRIDDQFFMRVAAND